jgi:hypothetical protein
VRRTPAGAPKIRFTLELTIPEMEMVDHLQAHIDARSTSETLRRVIKLVYRQIKEAPDGAKPVF